MNRDDTRSCWEHAPKDETFSLSLSLFSLEICEKRRRRRIEESSFSLFILSFLLGSFSIQEAPSTMPPRRGRAAAAAATESAANMFDETHNNENEGAAPLASSKQATTTAAAATQNANAAPTFSTPKLALRTFSRRKTAAEVSGRCFSRAGNAIGSK